MQLLSKVFSVKMVYRQLITIILSIYKNFSLHLLCKALHNRLSDLAGHAATPANSALP
jgi:hypothetical protein